MNSQTSVLLHVDRLSKRFGGLKAVQDLTFLVAKGETVGLIGPNGAGKSTAFNLISGALKPTGGTITLDGSDITGLPPSGVVKRGLARTFQSASVYPGVTVAENIYRGALSTLPGSMWLPGIGAARHAHLDGLRREVAEVLEITDLGAHRDTLAGTLPYGLQKKLGVAIGIATRPSLLLLDEPAAGLNPEECIAFGKLLRTLRAERQLTLLLVEHHMALVMDLCDRIVVLVQGRKIADAAPSVIRDDHAVIEAYLGAPDHAHA
ncbi:ABC transporter ATP-binding protein [Paraburkholderia sp. D1E]|uniref:ABC transporter ATP-binding protein n=1 Tax=Paraburkholderia sp. D1E TaxID=3461398 RepID=UPI0040464EA7